MAAHWRRETSGMSLEIVAETSLVASSTGWRTSMALLIWNHSSSFKHKVLLPSGYFAVMSACHCSYSLYSIYTTEFHCVSTAWINLAVATDFAVGWVCHNRTIAAHFSRMNSGQPNWSPSQQRSRVCEKQVLCFQWGFRTAEDRLTLLPLTTAWTLLEMLQSSDHLWKELWYTVWCVQ